MKSFKNIIAAAFIIAIAGCNSGNEDNVAEESVKNEQAQGRHKVKVNVSILQPQKFEHYFEVNGTVKSDYDVMLSPEMNGQIKKIYVQEGDKVSQGQLLAKLNTSVIENNVNEVKISLALAQLVYKKQEK